MVDADGHVQTMNRQREPPQGPVAALFLSRALTCRTLPVLMPGRGPTMEIRSWANALADFPDDSIEDEIDFVRFPGGNVAAAIKEILERLGCTVSEPIHAYENGWELDISADGRNLWCKVTLINRYLICLKDNVSFESKKRGPNPTYVDMLRKFDDALQADPRFHDVTWFADDEVDPDGTGQAHAVSDEDGDLLAAKGAGVGISPTAEHRQQLPDHPWRRFWRRLRGGSRRP